MRTIDNFDSAEFIREVRLRAVPSVDLGEISQEVPESVLNDLFDEFDLVRRRDGRDELRADARLAVLFWLLNSGPRIVRG